MLRGSGKLTTMANHHGRKKRLRELRERAEGLIEQSVELAAAVAEEPVIEPEEEQAEEPSPEQVITPDANSLGSKLKFWS